MDSFLLMLNRYSLTRNPVSVVDDLDRVPDGAIPEWWRMAFSEKDFFARKEILLNRWREHVSSQLINTISYLNDYLVDLHLILLNGEYSIIYTVHSRSLNMDLYYEGKAPVSSERLEEHFGDYAAGLDSSLQVFYREVHDGFYYYKSKSMGLDPLIYVESMDLYDWDYIDELTMDIRPIYNFFSNGMGDYIALDVTRSVTDGAYFWSKRELPKPGLNLWNFIDEWLVIGMEN